MIPPKPLPPAEDYVHEKYTLRGRWQDIGGISCYVVNSELNAAAVAAAADGDAAGGAGSAASSSSSGPMEPGPSDSMTVLMLLDHFSTAHSQPLLQVRKQQSPHVSMR